MYSATSLVVHLNRPFSKLVLILLKVHEEKGFHGFLIFVFFFFFSDERNLVQQEPTPSEVFCSSVQFRNAPEDGFRLDIQKVSLTD